MSEGVIAELESALISGKVSDIASLPLGPTKGRRCKMMKIYLVGESIDVTCIHFERFSVL